jgi:vacuolar-type H+-ATPase subunit I/STV1
MWLTRTCSILAILAGIAVVVLGITHIKPAIEGLQKDLADMTDDRNRERSRANKAEKSLAETREALQQEQSAHNDTKSRLAQANEARNAAEKRASDLADQLARTKADLEAAKQELAAWEALGLKPEQIKGLKDALAQANTAIGALKDENSTLAREAKKWRQMYEELVGAQPEVDPEVGVTMPAMRGSVIAVDPKWNFVVINLGKKNDVRERGVFLIERNGRLVSKVTVRMVQDDTCTASVMRGWNIADIQEGDGAVH